MKTFVLFYLSLFGFLNNPPTERSNSVCKDLITNSEFQPAALKVPSTFQLLAGNANANVFKKVLYHQNHYYVIGSHGVRATLSRFDENGNLIWSQEVQDTSSWNDFVINESGNILLVGSRDIQATLPKDVMTGVYNINGNMLNLFSYNFGLNESYNSIVLNPIRTTEPFRYYVVGSINLTNNRNDDDVIVTTMDEWGSSFGGMRRRYGSLNIDDEFHSKISIYDPIAGTFALCGSIANTGTYVVINGGGTVTNLGRGLGTNVRLLDLQRTANGEHLGSGYFFGSPAKGRIFKISSTPANTFVYESQLITGLSQILPITANGFFVIGETYLAGISKPVTMFCNDNGSTLTPFKGKYPSTGDIFGTGKLTQIGLSDLAYVDGRVNTTDGYGQQDGYLATHIGSYDDCGQDSLGGAFNKISLTPVIAQPTTIVESYREPNNLTSAALNYSSKKICNVQCVVEINFQIQDQCGSVEFTGSTNLGGTVSYCWDFGDATPCGSTLQNPSHNYSSPGNYQVCLSVSNGTSSCNICRSLVLEYADHNAPNIQCPPNITIDCSESNLPVVTGSPVVTDNLDPNPLVTYTDFVIQMTSCYKEILRDWSATDYCGNVVHCQQTIVQSDTEAPEISCPENIDLHCLSEFLPHITGWPSFTDNCQVSIVTSYIDEEISGPCPRIIKRTFTVTDLCQNSSTCIQEIRLSDFVAPIFRNCNRKFIEDGVSNVNGICEAEIAISAPTITDDCDLNPILVNNYNNTSNASGTYPEGTTLVTWTATDICGNTATCVDTVCVLPCATCPDTCLTDVILISTGYDPIDDILLPPGSSTSQWTLVESPLWGGSGSAPSFVINSIADWHDITGSQWISAHPFADWTQNNPAPDFIPYTFQNCFCVCQDSTLVGIKIVEALADDAMEVCLVDEFGNLIENLLTISSSGSSDHSPFDGSVIHSSSHSFILDEGKYCIRAKLRNLHGVAMGFNILGKIFGVGLLGSACCEQKNFVTGYKFIDKKCNGVRDDGIDMPGINWPILLKDENGDVVATTHTLGDGFYAFMNVPIGHYTVCEENLYGYIQSYPPSGNYEIDVVDAHSVVSGLNFGNCPLDTCCYDEEAFIDVATTPVDVIRDSCMICISHPCIGWCQRLTVFWGDGTSSGYFEGIGSVDASHTYTQSGEYEICLRFEELNDNGEVCFTKDSCFTVCVQCGICESEVMTLNCFGLYGDSEIPTVNGTLSNHSDFYIEADNNGGYYCTGHKTYNSGSGVSLYNSDVFVYKFDKDCGKCWELSFNGMDDDLNDQGLVLKHFSGGFYLGGIFASGSLVVPNGAGGTYVINNPSPGQIATFLIRYTDGIGCNNGLLPTVDWALALGNDKYRTLLSDMDVDNAENIIITGIFTGMVNFNPLGLLANLDNSTSQDMYFAKYSGATGTLIFASHLDHGGSSMTTGGVYPLGISFDPNDNDFYIAGHFSGDVDFLNNSSIDLGIGPSSTAPFVAKFTENALGIGVVWAFPISDISGTSPLPFYGVATDVEAYSGGFALSFEKYYGLGIVYNFNPRGSPFPEFNNNQTSYILRYDSDGIYQCHYTLPSNNFVNELSVDLDKNIYFIGGRNINLAFSPGSQLGYSFYNTFFGVVNNNCEAKTFDLDGNNEDAGWSIAPLGGKEFAIIGRSNSINLDADPNTFVSEIYSASEGDPTIPDIFIGKYSCECIMAPDTTDCCDKISVIAEKVDHPELTCIDSACCYSVDFYNDAGFSIKNATVNILTPGWEFGTVSVPSDLTVDSDPVSLIIENSSGNLPGGFTEGFVNFCLSGQIGSPNQQEIEFIWYEKTKSGACIAVCRDTIITDCIAPTCASNCVQLIDMEIVCDSTDPNKYCLFFNVENLSPNTATGLILDVSGTGYGLHPCGASGFFDPLEIDFGGGGLAPGATSGTMCMKLVTTTPVLTPQEVCFSFGLAFGETEVCYQDSLYCYELLPCCDPCEEIQIIAREIEVDSATCCFALDLNIGCAIDHFGKIEIEALTPGIGFGSYIKNSSWIYCTPPSTDLICLNYPATYLPGGYTSDVLQFCLDSTVDENSNSCWKMISAGGDHTLGIKEDGSLWAWGWNAYSQLGDGSIINRNHPILISASNDWVEIAAGQYHSLAIKNDGTLWAWGDNQFGQLGNGTLISLNSPTQVGIDNNWKKISAGNSHTIALKTDGTIWAWGANFFGQLGDGSWMNKTLPTQIGVSNDWDQINAGAYHSLAIKQNKSLWLWGVNGNGALGDGTYASKNSPTQVLTGGNWKVADAGHGFTIAIKEDGSLWSWGYNPYGALGNGTTVDINVPTQVGSAMNWVNTNAGTVHSIAYNDLDQLWSCGLNNSGQLGLGTFTNFSLLQQIPGVYNLQSISCGIAHTTVLFNNGQLWTWGSNNVGELGDGTNTDKNIPTFISCPQNIFTLRNSNLDAIQNSLIGSMFKVRFYESDDATVACDTMLTLECAPDTINRCMIIGNAFAECLPDQNAYKLTFTVDNISFPGFDAAELHVSSPDGNISGISPAPISLYPYLTPADPPRMVMCTVATIPFPDPDGIINMEFQLIDPTGNVVCLQTFPVIFNLPSCDTSCAVCPEHTEQGPNLIENGDFEYGNSDFISGHSYLATGVLGPGEYSVRNSTNLANGQWACIDHTTGSPMSNFLVADGPSTSDPIWQQSVNLQAGTTYVFCFWVNNLVDSLSQEGPPKIGASIVGGPVIITATVVNQIPDQWVLFTGTFTATTTGPAILQIWDNQTNEWDDIAIDDISLVSCTSTCVCDNLSKIEIYNSEFNTTVTCQGKNNPPVSYLIKCPTNETSFNIDGALHCSDSCDGILQWEIENNNGDVILFGTEFVDPASPVWTINLLYSQFTQGENYFVHLNGICGTDTCVCDFQFYVQECDTCCPKPEIFEALIQNAIHVSVDQNYCKATVTFDDLPCDVRIQSINWRDGSISNGPFYPGSMVMHTYAAIDLSYEIVISVAESPAGGGKDCNITTLKIPVSLNCKKCCAPGFAAYFQWQILTLQGLQTTINGCEVTVSAPQFGPCHFFETSPNWGDPPAPLTGPFSASTVWTHTYPGPGTYTICVTVSEYPFGDPTLEPCRSRQICEDVVIEDCNGPCICDGFSNLSFYYDKENKVTAECGDTLELECPPDDCVWIFSGNLLCKNDCPESLINWQLVDSYTSIPVASGTSVAFPGFGIYIPPAIVTTGGEYDLIIIGQCDPNVLCPCRIHLSFPGCDEVCPCDPDDLVADVEKGIGKIQILNDCISCFSPMALTECDMVTWYKLPNLTTPIGSSLGNQLFCHDFKYPGNYLIKMHVIRKNEDGSVCAEYEKIVSVIVNCTFPGPEFSNNCPFTSFANSKWILFEDGTKTLTSKSNTNKFTLTGNLNSSSFILSSESICLEKSGLSIQLNANLNDQGIIRHGSRLVIAAVPSEVNNQKIWENHVVLCKIALEGISQTMVQLEIPIYQKSQIGSFTPCQMEAGHEIRLMIYIENDLPEEIINGISKITFSDICIRGSELNSNVEKEEKPTYEIYPNPSFNAFTFSSNSFKHTPIQIEVYNRLGVLVEKLDLENSSKKYLFGSEYLPGMYLAKVSDGIHNSYMKIVKINR